MFEPHCPVGVAEQACRTARDAYAASIATLLLVTCQQLQRANPVTDWTQVRLKYDSPGHSSGTVEVRGDFTIAINLVGVPVEELRHVCLETPALFKPLLLAPHTAPRPGRYLIRRPGQISQWLQIHENGRADAGLVLEVQYALRVLNRLAYHLANALKLPALA